MPQISKNVSLRNFNTFGIEAKAQRFCSINSVEELKQVLSENSNQNLFILGGGSNILLTQDIDALVLHINIKGIEIIEATENHVTVQANAGENWHEFVMWTLNNNFGGLENLSLIPGNVGTSPMQNIGAYGVELKDTFISCQALNLNDLTTREFSKEDCKFGYRESIFKNEYKGQYIITSVKFKLSKEKHDLHLDYGAIREELRKYSITTPTIRDVSNAVITIRKSKLPDPKDLGNSGSFFKNPVISESQFMELEKNFENVPSYRISIDKIKVPAAWLIEKAGFKGKRFGDYGIHNKQALVLVNYGNANGGDIYELAQLIQKTVFRLFNIEIETEVNIV